MNNEISIFVILGIRCLLIAQDFSSPSALPSIIKDLESRQLDIGVLVNNVGFGGLTRIERVFTTLIRDQQQGLGFSISGGKGAEPFIEGSDAVFISKVAEDGPAAKDAKLMVGDKVIQVI